jgi:[lysine-biosynthesis-protein LysW]--L-2-aminoadipate ligase
MTNAARGGKATPCEASEELKELSIKAAEAVDGEIVGVDCMEGKLGFLVHEVNNTPEFKSTTKASGVDIAGAMLDYVYRASKK